MVSQGQKQPVTHYNEDEPHPENPQVLLEWNAPMRVYKRRGKHILRFYVALCLLLSAIVWLFGDLVLLLPIWATLFMFYTLTVTPPPEVTNRITTFGIETAGVTMRWDVLSYFYFTERFGFHVLTVVTDAPYYLHSYLIVPDSDIKQKLKVALSQHLVYQDKPQRVLSDRIIDWLSQLVPDDEDSHVEEPSQAQRKQYARTSSSRPVHSAR